jgi:hypothetical protein
MERPSCIGVAGSLIVRVPSCRITGDGRDKICQQFDVTL